MIVLTVSGRDKPGVSAELFTQLGNYPVRIVDVEQVVINDHLFLGVQINEHLAAGEAEPANSKAYNDFIGPLLADVTQTLRVLDMRVDIDFIDPDSSSRKKFPTHRILIMGQPIRAEAVAALAGSLAQGNNNIDAIRSVSDYPLTVFELLITAPDGIMPEELNHDLAQVVRPFHVDIAIEKASLAYRSKQLIVFDVDSTLVQGEVIEMLAEAAGAAAEVAEITRRAMNGELDFEQSLHERVATLAGLPDSILAEVSDAIRLTPGAKTTLRTLKKLGYKIGLVSGGFVQVIDRLAVELGVDFVRANRLEVNNGVLTGRVIGPVIDRKGKAVALQEFADEYQIPIVQTVAVGDGANDIDMISAAGLGIAFCAKPALARIADASLTHPYLDSILFLLGLTRQEVEALNEGYVLRH